MGLDGRLNRQRARTTGRALRPAAAPTRAARAIAKTVTARSADAYLRPKLPPSRAVGQPRPKRLAKQGLGRRPQPLAVLEVGGRRRCGDES